MQAPIDFSFAQQLSQYGIAGILGAILLITYLRQNKRLTQIENRQYEIMEKHTEDYVKLMEDYSNRIREITEAISKMTECLRVVLSNKNTK